MAEVTVTFTVDGDEEQHPLGVSEEYYEQITDAIMSVGGESPEFTKSG